MSILRTSFLALALAAGVAVTTAADAAPMVFRGCAAWGMLPNCLLMRGPDGKVYQLLDAGPAFPAETEALVYANPVGDIGLCFAPTAKVRGFKLYPGRRCSSHP